MIEGVIVKPLETFTDERGFFREMIRVTDPFFREGFGQWSVSVMYTGVIKAWHIHQKQVDWWYVHRGVLKVALYDTRQNSSTHQERMELLLGDTHPSQVLRIPPWVAHGCKCLHGPTDLFYITSRVYDPQDEGRIPYNDPTINYDWLKSAPIK